MHKIISHVPGKLAVVSFPLQTFTYRTEPSPEGGFRFMSKSGQHDVVVGTGESEAEVGRMLDDRVNYHRTLGEAVYLARRTAIRTVCASLLATATVAACALMVYVSPSPVVTIGDVGASEPIETENQIVRLTQEAQDLRKQNETFENEVVRWKKEAEAANAETMALNAQRASVEKLAADLATLVGTIEKSEAERAAQIAMPASQPGMEEMTRRLAQIYANGAPSETVSPQASQIPVVTSTPTVSAKPVEAPQAPSPALTDVSAGLGQISNLEKGGPSFDDHTAMAKAVEDVAAATRPSAPAVATDAPMTIEGISVPVSGDTGIEGDGGANDPNERSNFKDSLALLPAKPETQPSVALPGGDVAGIESRSAETDAQAKASAEATVNVDGRKVGEIEADRDLLMKARDALMSGQKLDPETLAKLPPEVALALQQKGAVLDPAEAVALQTDGRDRAVTIPESVARDYVNDDGFRTIPETNTWAATGGRLQLPPIGGGDILTADDFAMFDLRR